MIFMYQIVIWFNMIWYDMKWCDKIFYLKQCCWPYYRIIYFVWLLYSYQFSVTPLWYAAQCGHTDVVRVLLDAGADIEVKDNVSKGIFMNTFLSFFCFFSFFCTSLIFFLFVKLLFVFPSSTSALSLFVSPRLAFSHSFSLSFSVSLSCFVIGYDSLCNSMLRVIVWHLSVRVWCDVI